MQTRRSNWLIDILGKLFFPHQVSWQQRDSVRVFFYAIVAGVATGGMIVLVMLLHLTR